MARGVCTDEAKGVKRVQKFRPIYFTADWTDGALVQARLWGPRVLQDGSLGERDLDYRWKRTRATGPVKYSDLPSSVASRLLSYNTENGFKVLPEQL
jgi:exodeoxyribonuclease-3